MSALRQQLHPTGGWLCGAGDTGLSTFHMRKYCQCWVIPSGEQRDTGVYCFCTSPHVCAAAGFAQKEGPLDMCEKGGCLASTVSCKAHEMEIFVLPFWILITEICLNPV